MVIQSIALTGGMGTGKSTVLKFFQQHGFTIYDADQLVTELFVNNHEDYKDLALAFDKWLGTTFVTKEKIEKSFLRPFLEKTENGFPISLELVKPFVQKKIESLHANSYNPIIFEIPLLFEANMQSNFEKIILVTCDLEKRIERISLRQPHLSKEKIVQTINSQQLDELKKPYCNYIIDNSSDIDHLHIQLEQILPDLNNYYYKKRQKKFN